MTDGIYTLANDYVYDQLVALLNSIEANAGDIPVCIIAYDDNLDRVRAEVEKRENVTLMDDPVMFERWEEFSKQVWKTHPHALQTWEREKGIAGVYRLSCNHRYAAFDADAPFDRFIYLDADTLVLGSPSIIFDALDDHDFVVYDFQHKDPSHIFNLKSSKLLKVFNQDQINTQIFCSGCFASKRGLFTQEQRDWVVSKLADGEAEVLYLAAPNQSVLNYMTLRLGIPVWNLALHLPKSQSTGNSVTSPHFEERDHVLYDQGKRLTYLHYIGLSSKLFRQVCQGQFANFPYRDIFLHYRYLHEPENRPVLASEPVSVLPKKSKGKDNTFPGLVKRALRKLGLVH